MHFRNLDLWQKIRSHTTELLLSSSSQDVLGVQTCRSGHTHTPSLTASEHEWKHAEYSLPDPASLTLLTLTDTVPAQGT